MHSTQKKEKIIFSLNERSVLHIKVFGPQFYKTAPQNKKEKNSKYIYFNSIKRPKQFSNIQ